MPKIPELSAKAVNDFTNGRGRYRGEMHCVSAQPLTLAKICKLKNPTVQNISSMRNQENEQLKNLLRLRLAVAAIGESAQWWTSHICDPLRLNVLRQLFPKTWRLAAFSAVSDAAKLVHRAALAHRAYHLFRFQTELEQDLRRYLNKEDGKTTFDAVFTSSDAPLQVLEELAQKGKRSSSGAYELGEATSEKIYTSIGTMAALYLSAYKKGTRSFPYFLPSRGDD